MKHFWSRHVSPNLGLILDYARAFSGEGVRIVISLGYFLIVANQLSISDFGLFATASSVGVILSRVASFGFLSPLYRIATVKPRLVGVYTAGYAAAFLVSLPFVAIIAALVYPLVFRDAAMPLTAFALIVAAEILFWRQLEIVISVNNGLNRFGRAATSVVIGSSMKLAAALVFWASGLHGLTEWAGIYAAALFIAVVTAATLFFPRNRWRFRPALYRRRMADALSVSLAEVLFYAQMELDKLVVLAAGGSEAAGIYAIIMRLADLTALPVRTFTMMLVQRIMRVPAMLTSWGRRLGLEAGIFAFSVAAMTCMGLILSIWPTLLGRNVSAAAPFVIVVALVPGFRNLVEYQAELLYARGQTFVRAMNLALIGILKAALLTALLSESTETAIWLPYANLVFAALYVTSFVLTYTALRRPPRRI